MPGSNQTQTRNTPTMSEAQRKALRFQMMYFLVMILMLIVISNTTARDAIGSAANYVLGPAIGFHFTFPLMTIFLSGIIIGLITSIPRYFFTDWLRMGKMQLHTRAFSKAIRKAMASGQRDKIQKLRKKQMEVMAETQQITMNTMKPLMVLTVFTLLIWIWLDTFIYDLSYKLISFPWAYGVNISSSKVWIMPSWIIIYLIANLVFGYFVTMVIKWVDFAYKLRKMRENGITQ